MTEQIDFRFAPCFALLCGVIGGVLGKLADFGWQVLWPSLAVVLAAGVALAVGAARRSGPTPLWIAVLAGSFITAAVLTAGWGIVNGTAL